MLNGQPMFNFCHFACHIPYLHLFHSLHLWLILVLLKMSYPLQIWITQVTRPFGIFLMLHFLSKSHIYCCLLDSFLSFSCYIFPLVLMFLKFLLPSIFFPTASPQRINAELQVCLRYHQFHALWTGVHHKKYHFKGFSYFLGERRLVLS